MSSETTARAFAAATAHEFREEDIARARALVGHDVASPRTSAAYDRVPGAIRNFARSYGEGCPLYAVEDCGNRHPPFEQQQWPMGAAGRTGGAAGPVPHGGRAARKEWVTPRSRLGTFRSPGGAGVSLCSVPALVHAAAES